jgi:hypothetical protein
LLGFEHCRINFDWRNIDKLNTRIQFTIPPKIIAKHFVRLVLNAIQLLLIQNGA